MDVVLEIQVSLLRQFHLGLQDPIDKAVEVRQLHLQQRSVMHTKFLQITRLPHNSLVYNLVQTQH